MSALEAMHDLDDVGVEDEWVVVPTDWWRTPFTSVSWAYTQPEGTSQTKYARPPHRLEKLSRSLPTFPSRSHGSHGSDLELGLNEDLVGVKGVFEVLSMYEEIVGISDFDTSSGAETEEVPHLSRRVDEDEVRVHQERWKELMKDLTIMPEVPESEDSDDDSDSTNSPLFSSFGSSHSSLSSISCLGLPDLEHDYRDALSMPSTPKPTKVVHSDKGWISPVSKERMTRSRDLSPSSFNSSPNSRLNASATTFVPRPSHVPVPSLTFSESSDSSPNTYASSPSPPLGDFTFPSLNVSPYSKVKFEKDDQGFYSYTGTEEDVSPYSIKTKPPSLLPAFLQEESPRRKSSSRTRAMVDKLRSVSQEGSRNTTLDSAFVHFDPDGEAGTRTSTPAPTNTDDDDSEGWVSLGTPDNSIAARAQRKRDLFLALGKHQRSESVPAAVAFQSNSDEDKTKMLKELRKDKERYGDDGWLESPSSISRGKEREQKSRPKNGKIVVPSSALGGSAPSFPSLNNPTSINSGASSHKSTQGKKTKSAPAAPTTTARAAPPPVPVMPAPFVYPGYPVLGPVPPPMVVPAVYPAPPGAYPVNVVPHYPVPQGAHMPPPSHQRAQSLQLVPGSLPPHAFVPVPYGYTQPSKVPAPFKLTNPPSHQPIPYPTTTATHRMW